MAVDYTHTPGLTYRDYLASHYVKENIDVVLSKPIRQAIGSVEDIFKLNSDALSSALKDLVFFRVGPNENIEVVCVNLWDACGTTGGGVDTVAGFQSLFVQPDERGPSLEHLKGFDDAAAGGTDSSDPCHIASWLIRCHLYQQAWEELQPEETGDWRRNYLRGVLFAGRPGQPRSGKAVNLVAAELAFAAAAQGACATDPCAAALAHVGAGKAAYADGRLVDATRHFSAALDVDPQCGEAHYQLARLHSHKAHAAGVHRHLVAALECHWSYGLRAASDTLLAADHPLVVRCLRASTRTMVREARIGCAEAASRLKCLKGQDTFHPLGDNPTFRALAGDITRMDGALWADVLKCAFDIRKTVRATRAGIDRLAWDYCALLRTTEEAIVHRNCRYRRRRDPAAVARTIGAFVLPAMHAMVPAMLAATACLAASWPQPWWMNLLYAVAFSAGLVAFHRQWVATPEIDGKVCGAIAAGVAARQWPAVWLESQLNAARVAHNRRRLHRRRHRIEQRFGFVPKGERPSALQPAPSAGAPLTHVLAPAPAPAQ